MILLRCHLPYIRVAVHYISVLFALYNNRNIGTCEIAWRFIARKHDLAFSAGLLITEVSRCLRRRWVYRVIARKYTDIPKIISPYLTDNVHPKMWQIACERKLEWVDPYHIHITVYVFLFIINISKALDVSVGQFYLRIITYPKC